MLSDAEKQAQMVAYAGSCLMAIAKDTEATSVSRLMAMTGLYAMKCIHVDNQIPTAQELTNWAKQFIDTAAAAANKEALEKLAQEAVTSKVQ